MNRFITILYIKKSMSTPDITEESALDRINEYLELLRWTFKQIMFDEKTEKMCMEELRKIQWNDMSKIFVEYGHPILFLKLYFSLKNVSDRNEERT